MYLSSLRHQVPSAIKCANREKEEEKTKVLSRSKAIRLSYYKLRRVQRITSSTISGDLDSQQVATPSSLDCSSWYLLWMVWCGLFKFEFRSANRHMNRDIVATVALGPISVEYMCSRTSCQVAAITKPELVALVKPANL